MHQQCLVSLGRTLEWRRLRSSGQTIRGRREDDVLEDGSNQLLDLGIVLFLGIWQLGQCTVTKLVEQNKCRVI